MYENGGICMHSIISLLVSSVILTSSPARIPVIGLAVPTITTLFFMDRSYEPDLPEPERLQQYETITIED